MRKVIGVYNSARPNWVGDGFPVRTLFSYNQYDQKVSPFLLFDYAGPYQFSPTTHQRGVGQHPHRGFETVTIVYDGEVAHRDSSGGGGTIGPGDVQWMTAGGGVIHEEFHSEKYAAEGGAFEMVQLWVNLPAKDKMTPPRYQAITNAQIPDIALPDDAGRVRVIAGQYMDTQGAAETFSPVNVWDVRLNTGKKATFNTPDGHHLIVVVLNGTVEISGSHILRDAHVAMLEDQGGEFSIEASQDSKLIILSGEPLNEPIEGYGPFVMNSKQEIREAMNDFNEGRFGQIAPV
jgi:redox-sensitive bicupin YhaK (pirin superfamily)